MTISDTKRESMLRRSIWNNSADYPSAFCIANVIFMTISEIVQCVMCDI